MKKPLASRRKPASLASLLMHASISNGSRESEHTALAVIPWICSPSAVATTLTPVANNPAVRRNSAEVIPVTAIAPGQPCGQAGNRWWALAAARPRRVGAFGQDRAPRTHVGRHVVGLERGPRHPNRIAKEVALVEHLPR